MLPALLLTAGLGTRLDPLTRLVAKPAVPVAGQALVERILTWLHREGVRDVVLNLHHRPETIAAIVGDGRHLGVDVRYSWEPVILGSAGGPRHALPLLDANSFLIVNGDTLIDIALAPMIAAHESSGADVTMAVVRNVARDRYNGVLADADGRVTRFIPKGHAQESWHFVGVQIVGASVFGELPDGEVAETVSGVYLDLLKEPGRVRVWPVEADFIDVGSPADYLAAAITLAGASDALLIDASADVASSACVTRSIVWSGAHIGPNAHVTDCIVTTGAVVPSGFEAARKVIVARGVYHAAR